MKEEVRNFFTQVVPQDLKKFACEGVPARRFIAHSEELLEDAFLNPSLERYAFHVRTERVGRSEIKHYNILALLNYTVDMQEDFATLCDRSFVSSVSDLFSIEPTAATAIKELTSLLQHIVHDGEQLPQSIQEIYIDQMPKVVRSESFIKHNKQRCNFYAEPTTAFAQEYEHWPVIGTVHLNSGESFRGLYEEVRQQSLKLSELLKQQNVTPLLRHAIKLWIFHQLVSNFTLEQLKQEAFFAVEDLESLIFALQNAVKEKITALLALAPQERAQIAKNTTAENKYALSPLRYNLAQRIPALRLFVGHCRYDIHHCTLPSGQFSKKIAFYLKTYLNISLWQYLIHKLANGIRKAKKITHDFIQGEVKLSALPKAYWKLLRACFLLIWIPFLGIYFSLMGLTSVPFSLLRKQLGIRFGQWPDILLTIVETLKDIYLAYIGLPLVYELLTLIATASLGPVALEIGALISFGLSLIVSSPLLLFCIPDYLVNNYLFNTYPGWVHTNGRWIYKIEDDLTGFIKLLRNLTSNTFLSLHGFIAGLALVVLSTIALGGRAIKKAIDWMNPIKFKFTGAELQTQVQNMNHPQPFRAFLGRLAEKLKSAQCTQEDNQHLLALSDCKLTAQQKESLKQYLQRRSRDESVAERMTYGLDLIQIDRPGYFPSYKLMQKIRSDMAEGATMAEQVKETVAQVEEAYKHLPSLV